MNNLNRHNGHLVHNVVLVLNFSITQANWGSVLGGETNSPNTVGVATEKKK